MAGLEPRCQYLLDKGKKHIPICGRFDAHAGQYALGGQGCQYGERAPVAGRNCFPHPLRTRSPSVAARHLRSYAAFIQKHQAGRIDLGYELPPRLPQPQALSAVLLLGAQRFFVPQPQAAKPIPQP